MITFSFCTIELRRAEQLVVTKFLDGTEAHACPHDTPAYHAHAIEKTGVDDVLLYCWQHDVMHVIHGEMNSRPSIVLWKLAHGIPTDTPDCDREEREVQDLQRVMQIAARERLDAR